jgi:predicted alpha/beta-fold hydrolase
MIADYRPSVRWGGGHRMTVYAWARARQFPLLPAPEARYFDVAPEARVLAHCYWQPEPARHHTVLVLHGLEGSSSAHYMRGIADKARAAGFNAVLLNQRNCGGTEQLSAGLYHSGLTADPVFVLRQLIDRDRLPSIGVIGYSLGGNLALKLAGDFGAGLSGPHAAGAGGTPPQLTAVCAVSPTMDLALCVDALERRSNVIYQWNFVRNLKRRMRRKAALFPGRFDLGPLARVRSVRGFDEAYTAPHHGFRDADDYYFKASALRVVSRIAIPTLIVASDNDPFVPAEQFLRPEVAGNPHVTVAITHDGGHCGFVAEAPEGYDGYWAEHAAMAFQARHAHALDTPAPLAGSATGAGPVAVSPQDVVGAGSGLGRE